LELQNLQQVEVLGALKGLGEVLSTEEANILEKTNSASLQQFIKVSTDPGIFPPMQPHPNNLHFIL
jgi:hypothetical protein